MSSRCPNKAEFFGRIIGIEHPDPKLKGQDYFFCCVHLDPSPPSPAQIGTTLGNVLQRARNAHTAAVCTDDGRKCDLEDRQGIRPAVPVGIRP